MILQINGFILRKDSFHSISVLLDYALLKLEEQGDTNVTFKLPPADKLDAALVSGIKAEIVSMKQISTPAELMQILGVR